MTWEHDGELHKAIVNLTGINGTEENDVYTVESHYQDLAGNQLDYEGASMAVSYTHLDVYKRQILQMNH